MASKNIEIGDTDLTRPTPFRRDHADEGRHHVRDGAVHVTRIPGFPADLPFRRRPLHRPDMLSAAARAHHVVTTT